MPLNSSTLLRVSANGRLIAANEISGYKFVALADASVLISGYEKITGSGAIYRLLPDNSFDSGFGARGAYLLQGVGMTALALAMYSARRSPVFRSLSTTTPVCCTTLSVPDQVRLRRLMRVVPAQAGSVPVSAFAYLPESGIPSGALPVCRFYGTQGRGPNSHFYTLNPGECDTVKLDPGWTYEGIAFYLFAPVDGQCGAAQKAVYRAYNNRFPQNDSNHRYTADPNVYAQMQTLGWLPEGTVFCAPV